MSNPRLLRRGAAGLTAIALCATGALATTPALADTPAPNAAAEVVVPNGGFEEFTAPDSWVAAEWSMTTTAYVTDAAARSGEYSQAVNQWNDDTTLSQTLTAPEGSYDVSLFVWANESLGDSALVVNGVSEPIVSGGATQIDGTRTWDEIRVAGVPVGSDGALQIEIVLDALPSTTLTGFIDDVTVVPAVEIPVEPEPTDSFVAEPGFEDGGAAWQVGGTVTEGGREGSAYSVTHTGGADQRTSQVVEGLEDGTYRLTAWVQNDGGHDEAYLFAAGGGASEARTAVPRTNFPYDAADTWKRTTLRGVEVEGGSLEVGLRTLGASGSVRIDDVALVQDDEPYEMLIGGDISTLTYVEDLGGRYFDAEGRERDALQVLADSGWNVVRIRVYNDPGKGRGDGTYYTPEGYVNADDALELSQRAKAAGLQIQLSFHYSDYWTNPGTQMVPHAWETLIEGKGEAEQVDILEREVGAFTKEVLDRMAAQGTTPEYVAIGNETRSGMLYPYGTVGNWANLARFYNAGSSAIRQAAPDAKIIIHLDDGGNTSTYQSHFGNAEQYGVDYDIIGTSYYPYWTNISAIRFAEFATRITAQFGKPILVMETGMNYQADTGAGLPGQLRHNGPYGGADSSTPELQRDFMIELFNELQGVPGGMAIGDIYWDPVQIYAGGSNGWAYFESTDEADVNVIDNTTVFDLDGRALPVLDAYRLNTRGTTAGTAAGQVLDGAGRPVAGAQVVLSTEGAADRTASTNALGDYYFARTAPGEYDVRVEQGALGSATGTIAVTAGARSDADLRLPGTQALHAVSGSIRDEQGGPIGGASVTITGGDVEETRLSGTDGAFAFPGVPDGTYTLSAARGGFVTGTQTIEVAGADVVRAIELVADVGAVGGKVFGPGDEPVAGAEVRIGDQRTTSAEDGSFLIEDVRSGNGIVVTAGKEGYLDTSSSPVTVEHSETTAAVRIVLPESIPVANPSFETAGAGGDATAESWTFTSEPAGALIRQHREAFGGTVDGAYAASFWAADAYRAGLEQPIATEAAGFYSVRAHVYSGVTKSLTMQLKDEAGTVVAERALSTNGGPREVELRAETSGEALTVAFEVDGAAGDWAVVDQVTAGYLGDTEPGTAQPAFPGEDALTDGTRGPVTLDLDEVEVGGTVTILGLGNRERVHVWIASEPVSAGWLEVRDGAASLTLPSAIEPGQHRIVVLDEVDDLVGWAPITVVAADQGTNPGGGTGGGSQPGGGADGGAQPGNPGTAPAGEGRPGGLERTGAELGAAGAVALALIALGGGMLLLRRRRTQH